MKTLNVFLAACVFTLAALHLAAPPAGADPDGRRSADFHEITAGRIVLKSGDGKHSITLQAMKHQVGIGVGSPDARQVAIVAGGGEMPFVGFNHPGMLKGSPYGCPLAFRLEDDGTPTMQVVKRGRVKFIDLTKLGD